MGRKSEKKESMGIKESSFYMGRGDAFSSCEKKCEKYVSYVGHFYFEVTSILMV